MKFTTAGTYNLKIKTTDDCGVSTRQTRTIIVKDLPVHLYFVTNGGTNINPITIEKGETYTLSNARTTKEGWLFDGWFDNAALEGEAITTILMDEDKTVYAKWVEERYKTYVFNSPSNVKTLGINVPETRLDMYIADYGEIVATYDPWTEEEPYWFNSKNDQLWASYRTQIRTVVIGQSIRPHSLDFWFDGFTTLAYFDEANMAMIDTSRLESMKAMFRDCYELDYISFDGWRDLQRLTNIQSAFQNCHSMNNWNFNYFTCNAVEDFSFAFAGIKVRNENIGGSNLNNCLVLQSITFSKAQTVAYMFSGADLDNLVILRYGPYKPFPYCTNFNSMFSNITATAIFSEAFQFASGTVSDNFMFGQAYNLVGGAGTVYDINKITKEYAHPDGGTSDPGYFRASIITRVTYHENGGVAITPNPQNVTTGEMVDLVITTKEGYKLEGWYLDAALTQKAGDGFHARFNQPSVDLYANWIIPPAEGTHYLFADGYLGLGVADDDLANQVATHGAWRVKYENDATATRSIFYNDRDAIEHVYCASPKVILEPTKEAFKEFPWLVSADVSNLVTDTSLDLTGMFEGCFRLVNGTAEIDGTVAPISKTTAMFKECTHMTSVSLPTIPQNANYPLTHMNEMFYHCYELQGHIDLSTIHMNEVEDMSWLFYGCGVINGITLPKDLDTVNCQRMEHLFNGCNSLQQVINHELIDTHSALYLTGIWAQTDMVEIDCSNWSTQSCTSVSGIFNGCDKLRTIYATEEFCARPQITVTQHLFSGCTNLVGGNGTVWQEAYSHDKAMMWIDGLNGSPGLFTQGTPRGEYAVWDPDSKELTFFRDIRGKYSEREVIDGKTYFTNTDQVEDWTDKWTTTVKNNCQRVQTTLKPMHIKNAKRMFKDFSMVTTVNLQFFEFEGTDMSEMFMNCTNFTLVALREMWDVSNVTTMDDLFGNCSSLDNYGVYTILRGWTPNSLRSCAGMFNGCGYVTTIDLSEFDLRNVTDTSYMFYNCGVLQTITVDIGKTFDVDNITSSNSMFGNCTYITGGNGTTYDSSKTDAQMAYVDTPEHPGYLSRSY